LIGRNGVGKKNFNEITNWFVNTKKVGIYLISENINRKAPHQRAKKGMDYVPQGKEIIP